MSEQRLKLLDEGVMLDPSQHFAELRAAPPFYDQGTNTWVLSKYGDVKRALEDDGTFSNRSTLQMWYPPAPEALAVLMNLDVPRTTAGGDDVGEGEVHKYGGQALRITMPYTPRRVQNHPSFGRISTAAIHETLNDLPNHASHIGSTALGPTVDMMAHYAWPIPLKTIMDFTGVPRSEYNNIKGWSEGQIELVWGKPSAERQVQGAEGLAGLWGMCQQVIADRKKDMQNPGLDVPDDLTTMLLNLKPEQLYGHQLTDAELASLLFNLLVAGHETTSKSMANALHYTLSDKTRWQEFLGILNDPEAVKEFVKDHLRKRSSIVGWFREANEDVNIGGTTIPKRGKVLALIGAANLDPEAESDPTLTYGIGKHYCPGGAMATAQIGEAMVAFANRYPGAVLKPGFNDRTDIYPPSLAFRGPQEMPVVLEPNTSTIIV